MNPDPGVCRKRPGRGSGFTLLEVMLAVLVLGISLTVFYASANQGVGVVSRARSYQDARELLDWVELKAPLEVEELEEGTDRGRVSHPEFGPVNWTRDITRVGEEEDPLYRVVTAVEAKVEGRPVRESVERMIYPPDAVRGVRVREPWDE